jgi:hypothetical protein
MKTVLHFHPASWFYIAGSLCFVVGTVLKEVMK